MKSKNGWKKIGKVSVDSGNLLLVDPCYIDSIWKKGDEANPSGLGGGTYEECCEAITQSEHGAGQVIKGLAVCSGTGFGDGIYEVYACIEDGYIAELRVDFRMSPQRRSKIDPAADQDKPQTKKTEPKPGKGNG
jgi:hypothetical protein